MIKMDDIVKVFKRYHMIKNILHVRCFILLWLFAASGNSDVLVVL